MCAGQKISKKKIEKEPQSIKKKNTESWSSESNLDDDEEYEVQDEYQQEGESSEDTEEKCESCKTRYATFTIKKS